MFLHPLVDASNGIKVCVRAGVGVTDPQLQGRAITATRVLHEPLQVDFKFIQAERARIVLRVKELVRKLRTINLG